MGKLSKDLADLGYSRTEEESPFVEEGGELWSKGYELVCDETGIVIRNSESESFFQKFGGKRDESVYRYQNSENVKLPGGYTGSYSWGKEDDEFLYDGDF